MKFSVFILALLICSLCDCLAQSRKITGFVVDAATQKPIENVNIVILGTTVGAATNYLGAFEITISDPNKFNRLIASHIGFRTKEVVIPIVDRFKFSLWKEVVRLEPLILEGFPKTEIPYEAPPPPIEPPPGGFMIAESTAAYPKGMDNFRILIANGLFQDLGKVEDKFVITFTIDQNGKATEIEVPGVTPEIAKSVNRIFGEMTPWIPATQRGKTVSQRFSLHINSRGNPNGLRDFYQFLSTNIRYPVQALRMGIAGSIDVEFTISSKGKVTDVVIARDIGAGCGDEIKRVLLDVPVTAANDLVDETHANNFQLPVDFSLGPNDTRVPIQPSSSDVYVLGLIQVAAMGLGAGTKNPGTHSTQGLTQDEIKNGLSGDWTYANLEEAIGDRKTAKRLALRNRQLTTFPNEILALDKLVFLDLSGNEIKTIPTGITYLKKLKKLVLTGNTIDSKDIELLRLSLPKAEIIF